MLAACRQCDFRLTVASADQAAALACPRCDGGKLTILEDAEAAKPEPAALTSPSPTSPVVDDLSIEVRPLAESSRWRLVLHGLAVLHVSILFALFGLVSLALVLAAGVANPFGYRRSLLAGAVAGHLSVGIVVLVGLALCCFAPLSSPGRRYAQTALLLGVLSIVLVPGTSCLIYAPFAVGLGPLFDDDLIINYVIYLVVLLNGVAAFACLLLYLRELAVEFKRELTTWLYVGLVMLGLWFGLVALTPWVVDHPELAMPILSLVYSLAMLLGAAVLITALHKPIMDLRQALTKATEEGRKKVQRGSFQQRKGRAQNASES